MEFKWANHGPIYYAYVTRESAMALGYVDSSIETSTAAFRLSRGPRQTKGRAGCRGRGVECNRLALGRSATLDFFG